MPGAKEAQLHISQGLAVCVMTQSVPKAFWLPGMTLTFPRDFLRTCRSFFTLSPTGEQNTV